MEAVAGLGVLGLFGWVFFFGLVGAILGASRGSVFPGAVVSIFFGPVGWIIILSADDARRAPCPRCSERVFKTAQVCPFCACDLSGWKK